MKSSAALHRSLSRPLHQAAAREAGSGDYGCDQIRSRGRLPDCVLWTKSPVELVLVVVGVKDPVGAFLVIVGVVICVAISRSPTAGTLRFHDDAEVPRGGTCPRGGTNSARGEDGR